MSDACHEEVQGKSEKAFPDDSGSKGFLSGIIGLFLRLWCFISRSNVAEASARNLISRRYPVRSGNTMPWESLAPKFHPENHQVYLDLIERSLAHPDTRNIALTGAYGSGKSSILHELARTRRRRIWRTKRVVELSLSTLDPNLTSTVQPENKAEAETSNRIQKELVKQLLYQLPPRKTPHSRFQRASKPSYWTGAKVALIAAMAVLVAWFVLVVTGWQDSLVQRVTQVGWEASWFWGTLAVGPVVVAVVVWWVTAGRYSFKAEANVPSLSVSLEPTATSYFDQYLDEIMYFFQVSKTEIVLIEDVDRFDDAIVFDTLRALNTLVNNSDQVNRRVVFIYAIRDSVLSQIGVRSDSRLKHSDGDLEYDNKQELHHVGLKDGDDEAQLPTGMVRANRTKYFDVIIPIVPFLSTINARDLMTDERAEQVIAPQRPTTGPAWNQAAEHHATSIPQVVLNPHTDTEHGVISVRATWQWETDQGDILDSEPEQRIYYFAFNDDGKIHDYTYETVPVSRQ